MGEQFKNGCLRNTVWMCGLYWCTS